MKKLLLVALTAIAVSCSTTPKQKVYVTDVQAHRGGMGLYPEESLAAMLNAVDLGVNTLEMDLCITQDREVVLSHDKFFHHRYATRPDGTPVMEGDERVYLWNLPYEEVLKWDVGQKAHPDWPEKNCQPAVKQRAAEVIDAVEAYCKEKGLAPMKYNIEIKCEEDYDGGVEGVDWPHYKEFTDLCMQMLEERKLGDRLIIQCFDARALNYIHKNYPGHILSYLVEDFDTNYDEYMSRLDFTPEWLSPHYSNVNRELMDRAHKDGMKVVTWTVDDKAEMHRLIGLGVEAIISNYPDRLLEVVKSYSAPQKEADQRLVIITFDGLRWQEVFGGADETLLPGKDSKYWKETAEERRQALLPFLWSYAPEHGYLLGNRWKNSLMQLDNKMCFSYPGYSEMFCGWADDERINSNAAQPNPNVSVLEVANQDPRYRGKVMMYSSWESIRFAVNNERGGFKGSSAHEPSYTDSYVSRMMEDMDLGIAGGGFGSSERLDCITYGMALETLVKDHPLVFYVAFGDTDEYAHEEKYDLYLESAHWTDLYIRRIVEACEADPFYKGKTTYLLTCDHGRGSGKGFRDHTTTEPGSEQTWFIAFGKDIPVLGETADNGPFYTKQLAATIADILDIEFTPGNGIKCKPFLQ